MKLLNFFLISYGNLRCVLLWLLFSLMDFQPSFAYDNGIFPPFEIDKIGRGYNSVSIHLDGEQWLISECIRIESYRPLDCQLFLHNLRSKRYQRYQLPSDYIYTDAQFSPSGRLIVGVRRPVPKADTYEELVRTFGNSEIFTMRLDGTHLKVYSDLKGHLKMPTLSEDETKLVYWKSSELRSAGEKTTFAHFDVYEFDLATGREQLFAGPFRFFEVRGLQYLNKDRIILTAYGPSQYAAQIGKYRKRFNSSEIYLISRGESNLPDPSYTEIENASDATLDKTKNLYFLGMHKQHGISIFRFDQHPAYWRIPPLVPGGISALIAAPDGQYIGFIYPVNPARASNPTNSLGIFDLREERWIPLHLPPSSAAELISAQ